MQKSVKNVLAVTLSATLLTLSSFSVFAEADKSKSAEKAENNIEITPAIQTTKEEVAVVHVLSEICPDIIGKNQNFNKGYERMLTEMLPGISDPVLAVEALSEEGDYQEVLSQARQNASKYSREDNREVCLEMVQWGKKTT
ncbi:hypothetical protein MKI79_07700 [Acinetobacter sp. A3.8]|uniref:DUF7944 domain-containing protein n=1 Tax=Acinetobacter sedimenti TaxID=2919922 RepID=A0A9X2B6J4_9GAMM|nr:hypothetical protein [Acinetobacter sedimenti]MCJ8146783.1 hypothetical protein [Acinetobacter sedimenti]